MSIDHYSNLGLPSGSGSLNLTSTDITNAYKRQSLLRHPDKHPNDPNATADFQLLQSSYDVLGNDLKRGVYDATIRAGIEKRNRDERYGAKRRKLASDLEERERGEGNIREEVRRRNEKDVAAAMKKELEEFQARIARKAAAVKFGQTSRQRKVEERAVDNKTGDYTSEMLLDYEASIMRKLLQISEKEGNRHAK